MFIRKILHSNKIHHGKTVNIEVYCWAYERYKAWHVLVVWADRQGETFSILQKIPTTPEDNNNNDNHNNHNNSPQSMDEA